MKDLKGDELLWGDEIEYGIFHLDPEAKKIRLSLRAKEVSLVVVAQRANEHHCWRGFPLSSKCQSHF